MVIANFNTIGGGAAYAWIGVYGSSGKGVEARIGSTTYGVSVFTDSGFTYIPVPKPGTYTLYNNGSDTAIATVDVTKPHEVYNSGTVLNYPFSRITDDQFIDVVNKLQTGDILPSDLPWKAGDSRDTYLSDANTKSTIYIVDTTGNNGFTFVDGTKPHYVIATTTSNVQDKFKETFKPFLVPAGGSFEITINGDATKSTIITSGNLYQTNFVYPSYQDLYDLSDLKKYDLYVEEKSGIENLWYTGVEEQLTSAYRKRKCKKLEYTDAFQLNNYSGIHFPTRDRIYTRDPNYNNEPLESRLGSPDYLYDGSYYNIDNASGYNSRFYRGSNGRIIVYYGDSRKNYDGVGGTRGNMYLACI